MPSQLLQSCWDEFKKVGGQDLEGRSKQTCSKVYQQHTFSLQLKNMSRNWFTNWLPHEGQQGCDCTNCCCT